ncbi:uncharacterized protein A4U43_C04F34700 [Asparagus officinalis]|uniref:Uncharacterized protein n=1 Tax=Asparagus officinalis TaxID=4686 RepID=A0A5P1F6J8_ASPOF|nr:uncharacterized protein A4U43_C04F34700 [Asparagus officinalis]
MEMELEPRVKPLPYKVKATSRESPSQKGANVLDSDLRTHWSTATNNKEWILLELEPEAFVKVRPRCEAPRRDMMYPMNYTPCRYVRISCLRGNPIAIFFIQLIGVPVKGLEPEFQPVVNYLLPDIISHKQEAHDMHLQLLQDMTSRLLVFLPQLETDLANFTDATEFNMRFFAMLTGPFYPILHILKEREAVKALQGSPDSDALKSSQTSILTVSSNFEVQPRRARSPHFVQATSSSLAFRSDAVFMLLKKAYNDSHLGTVSRIGSTALHRLIEPSAPQGDSVPSSDLSFSSNYDEASKSELPSYVQPADYSSLFGEEFKMPDTCWDATYLNTLDTAAVEEGIFHVLYACASQPLLCSKLAESNSDFWSVLPLIQALLPALRPPISSSDQVDDSFSQWKHRSVQHALSQIVMMSSCTVFRPLLRACAGYLSSFSLSHAKAACVLIDLCSGSFSPWVSTIAAKVDLAIELIEDLLGIIQGASHSIARARAALKYILLALSGHMDDVLAKYKENKHKILFLLEMLEPFLDPAISAVKSSVAFGDVSPIFLEKQNRTCAIVLNIIRIAARRPAVLPPLESEWRCGSVAPSVLLSILGPHIPLPPEIDLCKCSTSKAIDQESETYVHSHGVSSKSSGFGESDEKIDTFEPVAKIDALEDANLFFAPPELKKTVLTSLANHFEGNKPDKNLESTPNTMEGKYMSLHEYQIDNRFFVEFFNLQADYIQLVDHHDCELRSSEFQQLALDLSSQHDITPEGHDAAIDALLLAAECYVNPFFMVSCRPSAKLLDQLKTSRSKIKNNGDFMEFSRNSQIDQNALEKIAHLEAKRDKSVLQILLQAAKLNKEYQIRASQGDAYLDESDDGEQGMNIHSLDIQSADAVTLVRQNQALLCQFIMQQLQREQHLSHEILLQSLLFILQSATELFCPPEDVIDIILQSAENLNGMFMSLYYQLKEGNMHFDFEKLHVLQRRWVLLQRLVLASSGSDDRTNFLRKPTNQLQFRCLVPPSAWMQKIPKFSSNTYPLPRFLGWMAVSRYARLYLKERLFLASDLSHLTSLLTIFTDELTLVNVAEKKLKAVDPEQSVPKDYAEVNKETRPSNQSDGKEYFCVLYPDLHKFFPSLKEQFGSFGEIILEAVGMQLKCLPCSAVPDILCWLSDLCMWPYSGADNGDDHTVERNADNLRGYNAVNAKATLLYLLESIVSEHMEAMVPEMPKIAQILISLCKSSYCDVAFLDSILRLLQPLISYFLKKVTDDGRLLSNELSCLDFELNFEELLESIRCRKEHQDAPRGKKLRGSLMIFILGSLFRDFSSRRKIEILHSLLEWVDFTTSEPTTSFYDYLCAFHKVVDSFHLLLIQNMDPFGALKPFKETEVSEHSIGSLGSSSYFPSDFANIAETGETDSTVAYDPTDHGLHYLSADEIKEFSEAWQLLISKFIPAIEMSWKLHYQLAMKLTYKLAKCFFFLRCLCSISQEDMFTREGDRGTISLSESNDLFKHWQNALEGLTGVIIATQQNQCWQVGSAMLDYLLRLPRSISLDCVLSSICSAIKHFILHAPRISWRLQTDKWLSYLFMRGIGNLDGNEAALIDLFSSMLGHWEPEQRSVALQHLGRIVCLDHDNGVAKLFLSFRENLTASDSPIAIPESVRFVLVSSTWDRVAAVSVSDPSILLRSHAMALLSGYIPYADRTKLQSFLVATNTFMRSMGRISPTMEECHVTRLSLGLLASACLYSAPEDISLIPENVWQNLENIGMSKTGGLDDADKKLCQALCKLKAEPDVAKEALEDALSSSSTTKQSDPNFRSTRESILQVFSSLTSIQSYFDFFSRRSDQEAQELEEAEIEIDLLQKEKAQQEVSRGSQEETFVTSNMSCAEDGSRLCKIKDEIQSLEKAKLREEIAARRQKKLLMRRTRQKSLEEAASREMQLLQEIDRERTIEMERTIERQRQLELERSKTRELQFNLDMERERQTQKELQRELEQVESGVRSSRREFSSNPNSRPRDRYRERDNVRPSSRGRESSSSQSAAANLGAASPSPTVVLAGSRSFSGQLPTILQSRERMEERSAAYEESFDGSRDSGDASSVGDPELGSAFDGFGSGPRRGSSKSRGISERREREGRREGKWERKH